MNTDQPAAFYIPLARRRFLKALAAASAGFALPGALAEALTVAPELTQGPYYPLAKNLPLDDDNDLLHVNGHAKAATGIVTYLGGRVLDIQGEPIKDALVELWHADHAGEYIYDDDSARNSYCDPDFQGFGQFLTASDGRYLFRTVKAGLYEGRTRHFHVAVTVPGRTTRYTTQTFWNETARDEHGEAWDIQNDDDMVFTNIDSPVQRAAVNLTYTPVDGVTKAVGANFDFVVGRTPVEPTYPVSGGFLSQGTAVPGPGTAPRYRLTIPVYKGYTYEVYGNPTLADLAWSALPFALSPTGPIDRNRQTITVDGSLSLYVDAAATKDVYHVSFRVPGANTGTP